MDSEVVSASTQSGEARLAEQVSHVKRLHQERYGVAPEWVAAAPGRVNLIGEHTDYNAGFVFPLAIDRCIVIAASRLAGDDANTVRVASTTLGEMAFAAADLQPERKDWTSYVRGVFAGFQERGVSVGPLAITIDSRVPLGGGLSSSAALEVATATLLEAASGKTLDPVDKARLCQKAEHVYAGMPCGIMDQFSSALGEAGKLLLIDCRTETAELIPLDDPNVVVLIVNSNVKHELTGSEYSDRRSQCEQAAKILGVATLRDATLAGLETNRSKLSDVLYRRAKHVIGEIARTVEASKALQAGNWSTVGKLMYASHTSLRDDYEVSCAELDVLVELAGGIGEAGGVIGARMTGGGFGGCIVALVRKGTEETVADSIAAGYRERTGIEATGFVTTPARGAHIVQS